ncbi:tripartite tricarboxylate transporter substrate binding protein [Cupriavidus gilardii]|uniref:Bug family tripartite tricarboxylate transporter substrate binding protein n=1 Tax=Cupriavidus gilardii TaxID=82541 RepID=UPI001EE4F689|nr:tripartite tricarboxylate transporter substrate binding protein [Cupriavidus gilardii]MCG5261187.1 tripartite tricarboxylate transporter substrate binding protein [Cupriavidus gilardii]MDF9428459.1 tripartite tricarboxylate transporter substrate binding protein [Cupriavidus gilardii]
MRKTAFFHFAVPLALAFGVAAPSYGCGEPGASSRPIRLVVSQQAGGSTDTLARMWAERVGKTLQTPIVVENRAGAGGIIAAKYVLSQPADGCTLFLAGVSQMVLNKFVYAPLAYKPESDFAPVSMLATVPFVLVANPQSGLRNYRELVDAARAKPGSISFASSGNGNSTHLVVELMQKQQGIKLLHVPYRGEPDGVVSTVSGATQVMAPVLSTALPQIKAGKLTPLMLFASKRVPELPDVPTAAELGLKGFENIGWSGIAAKAGTPANVIARLHAATQTFLAEPAVVDKLKSMQVLPMPGPSDQLMEQTVRDTAKWQGAIGDLDLSAK